MRQAVDPAAVLRAVERMGADLSALSQAVQSQAAAVRSAPPPAPVLEAIAALAEDDRLDRLSTTVTAAIDRLGERIRAIEESTSPVVGYSRLDLPVAAPGATNSDERVVGLEQAIGRLADEVRGVAAATPVLDLVEERLAKIEQAGGLVAADPRLDAVVEAVAAANPGERLGILEEVVVRLAEEVRRLATTPEDPRLDVLLAAVTAKDGDDRFVGLEQAVSRLADEVRTVAASTPALDRVDERLARIEQAADLLAADPRLDVVAEAVAAADPGDRVARLEEAVTRLADEVRGVAAASPTLDRVDERLTRIEQAADLLAADPRLDAVAAAVVAADPGDRLARLEAMVAGLAEEVRHPPAVPDDPRLDVLGGAIADAFEHFGGRLASIEAVAGRVALDARVVAEQVGPVPSRLNAIAGQVDRITPLVRVGEDAGSLFEQLDRIGSTLDRVVGLIGSSAGTSDEMEQLDAVTEVLSGLVRRQEQMGFVVGSILDQVRGPRGSDPILERLARLERSIAIPVDDAAVRLQTHPAPGDGPEIKKMLLSVVERVDTLSHIVAGMTKDSSAELSALQQRIVRSLGIFDTVRLQVKEFAERPPLTQDEVHWIADAVTRSLLESVRVETAPRE